LIEEKATLDQIAHDNSDALAEFLRQPECRVIVAVASPIGNVSDEWIKDKTESLIKVMEGIRPSLAKIIIETPGGAEWFYESLKGLRGIIFGKPTIPQIGMPPDS